MVDEGYLQVHDIQFTVVNQTSVDYIEVCLAFEMNSFKGKDESVV